MRAFARQMKRWLTHPGENLFAQIPRALAASSVAASVDLAVLIALVEWFGWHPAPAAIVAYLVGGVLQYVLCSVWVFANAPQNAASGFAVFTVLSLVGLGITWLTIMALTEWADLHYGFAKIVSLAFAFVWNFSSRKYLLFRPEGEELLDTKETTSVLSPASAEA